MPAPELLTEPEIARGLAALPGWVRSGPSLTRSVECPDYPSAIALVVRAGFVAEQLGHHPDLDVRWRTVLITCTTHERGGLTALDFELAGALDRTFEAG